MAKFKSSEYSSDDATPKESTPIRSVTVHDSLIGEIIGQSNDLKKEDLDSIIAYQSEHGVRFGEAAIALGYASHKDVLMALAAQFHYPLSLEENAGRLSDELVMATQPFSQRSEAFRAIRSRLLAKVFRADAPRSVLAVVSPEARDGKSYFAANLAVAFSQLGARTILVDADFRMPRQHAIFNIENATGLSSLLAGRSAINVIQQIRSLPDLFVMPAGSIPPNPQELVERAAFGVLMVELRSKFDYVIVDTPAFSHGADAGVIASKCGQALVIARKDVSHMNALQDMVTVMSDGTASICGVVMNEY